MSFTSNSTSINKLGAVFQGNIVKAGNKRRKKRGYRSKFQDCRETKIKAEYARLVMARFKERGDKSSGGAEGGLRKEKEGQERKRKMI